MNDKISRINIRTETFCTTWNNVLYCIDICEDTEKRTAWLYNPRYGVKTLMFGLDAQNDRGEFLDTVFANLPDYIKGYQKEVEDE